MTPSTSQLLPKKMTPFSKLWQEPGISACMCLSFNPRMCVFRWVPHIKPWGVSLLPRRRSSVLLLIQAFWPLWVLPATLLKPPQPTTLNKGHCSFSEPRRYNGSTWSQEQSGQRCFYIRTLTKASSDAPVWPTAQPNTSSTTTRSLNVFVDAKRVLKAFAA